MSLSKVHIEPLQGPDNYVDWSIRLKYLRIKDGLILLNTTIHYLPIELLPIKPISIQQDYRRVARLSQLFAYSVLRAHCFIFAKNPLLI